MIELNKKTQQDFLNRKWVQRLLDAGVDMSDAKYIIMTIPESHKDFVDLRSKFDIRKEYFKKAEDVYPTYTVSELLYKLHEYIYPTIDGKQFSGGLKFCKDAPFYMWYYGLYSGEKEYKEDYIYAEAEYPIESLAMLLIQCHKKDIGIPTKDTGDISSK